MSNSWKFWVTGIQVDFEPFKGLPICSDSGSRKLQSLNFINRQEPARE